MNKIQPEISVIMSVYKENEFLLKRSIDSILNQTFDNFEFIIILDNPENKTAELKILKYSEKDKRIIFLKNEKNIGQGFSRNKGFEIAKGKYIALMDADDYSYPERFEIQKNYLELNKDIDLLFTSYEKKYPDKNSTKYIEKNHDTKKILFSGEGFLNATIMAKSEILKKHNYKLSRAPEEFELFFRIIKAGVSIETLKEVLYIYHIQNKELIDRYLNNNYGNKTFLKLLISNFTYFYRYSGYFTTLFNVFLAFLLTRNKYIFSKCIMLKDNLKIYK
ncbi:hypothetical protein HNP86_000643 [Methanococcus maripaludis]|uniref:Glycosyltransferase 2-like domain-containing protein n=1 Tax=Methanococcus maripaludis TaxID=39152 RepID=A0A7J9NS62_METMI|nr:glycosyltransferase family 2 protein [Methanococcus maripaludis]MBA2850512.1 hypothetical protein [Methanococcus maripaludis]